MKRGEIWTFRDEAYASKARPVVIVSVEPSAFESVVVCLLTTFCSDGMAERVVIEPDEENGLAYTSYVMADKIVTTRKAELGTCVGSLDDETMQAVSQALALVLGLGGTSA